MRIMLAPMEGVLDGLLRQILTNINHYNFCTTEFVRVVNCLLPKKTFYRLCPELHFDGYTLSKTPVRIQLLGSDSKWLAENAVRAIELGSHGIDLNCGCPAKKVVGSEGGAFLLNTPDKIYDIVKTIRSAISKSEILSVKMRLGFNSNNMQLEIADAICQGGANEVTVHGRTKKDGYKADKINWQAICDIQSKITIPVIANGEIMSTENAKNCVAITKCNSLMIGRGALQTPNLASMIKKNKSAMSWQNVLLLFLDYLSLKPLDINNKIYHVVRIKQWLHYLKKNYVEAEEFFNSIKKIEDKKELSNFIQKLL